MTNLNEAICSYYLNNVCFPVMTNLNEMNIKNIRCYQGACLMSSGAMETKKIRYSMDLFNLL